MTPKDIHELLSTFSEFAKETLLFLRNVCEIEIKVCNENGEIEDLKSVRLEKPDMRQKSLWNMLVQKHRQMAIMRRETNMKER